MIVKVTATSWALDSHNGNIHLKVETDELFTRENKSALMKRICTLVEMELERDELLKKQQRNDP